MEDEKKMGDAFGPGSCPSGGAAGASPCIRTAIPIALDRAAKTLVPFALGTFEDQRRKPSGEHWLVPPYSPNDRAREAAALAFRAMRFDADGTALNWTSDEADAMVRGWNRAQDRGRGIRESLFAVVNEWCRHHLAQAIEARSAETPLGGSVHESAVGNADAPKPSCGASEETVT